MMDKIGHGNCMASLAGGAVYGVSKKAKLVPVKYKYQLGAASHQAIAAAFTYIIGKVKTATQPGMTSPPTDENHLLTRSQVLL